MKKIFFLLFVAIYSTTSSAQLPVWTFYHQQHRTNGTVKFMIPGFVFKLGGRFVEDKDLRYLSRKIGTLRLVVSEGQDKCFTTSETKRFVKRLHQCKYEDLLSVKDGNERVNIMVKERKGTIRRFVLLVDSEDEAVMISGKCRLSPEDFLKFSNSKIKEIKKPKTMNTSLGI